MGSNIGPQALGKFKGKLDLTYKASNYSLTMYRALKITDLSLDLSGEYLCVVSTFEKESSMKKTMVVLGKYMTLNQNFLQLFYKQISLNVVDIDHVELSLQ